MSVLELSSLHFLRPWCLLAAVPLPGLLWWWLRRRRLQSPWRDAVDAHLLPHLLETHGGDRQTRMGLWVIALGYLLAVIALAGPSWRRSAQPLWQSQAPLVIAMDLSSATSAADMPPSRLAQARAKLSLLLRERTSGQVGLVAYARDAFTVAPLTDDAGNVALFLDALQPDVMPRDGQNTGEAIRWSAQLLQRAGATRGDIAVLTDHADEAALAAAADAASAGYRVSALGLGTEAGAAYRRATGEIANARLDAASLRRLARSGNGRYAALSEGDADLRALGLLDPGAADAASGAASGLAWQDEGYWLIPPLMLLALFAFRRGGGALALVLLCIALPMREAQAADLWRRPDQAAHARLQRGNEAYRRGDYATATQEYQGLDSATAHYNRGNALAKTGQYPQAIAAYDRALKLQPGMADAIANKRAVEAAMKRKPSQGADGGHGSSQQRQGGQSPQQASQHPSQQGQQDSQAKPQESQQGSQQQSQQRQPSKGQPAQPQPASAKPQDAKAQAEADRAQRERMQKALQARERSQAGRDPLRGKHEAAETPEQRERRLANEAWLRRVPDDPGGLLRAKFRIELERRAAKGKVEE